MSRLAAEEQVKCWASLESVEIADIHTLVKMLLQDSEGAVSRYRYNSVFEILLDSLIGSWRGIPPALLLSPFVRITIEFCRTILEARYE